MLRVTVRTRPGIRKYTRDKIKVITNVIILHKILKIDFIYIFNNGRSTNSTKQHSC